MAKPYSIDLRERAVAAVLKGGLSRHRAAAQFGVAASTVINWVRRFQETGSVVPGQMGGHKPKAIAGEHQVFLARRVREGGLTLCGLVRELAERGLKVDYRSVDFGLIPIGSNALERRTQAQEFGERDDDVMNEHGETIEDHRTLPQWVRSPELAALIGSQGSSDFIRASGPSPRQQAGHMTEGRQPFTAEIKTLAKRPSTYDPLENI